jgi:regulator of protease activity HflC (stomatin/prohibitin superfamily)
VPLDPVTIAALILVIVVVLVLVYLSIRIVNEYDRLVVFRLGRTSNDKVKGPGLVFLIPIIDRPVRVDLREQFIEVPSQTTITKDNAPINIDFLIYWRIVDPLKSIVNVAYFAGALQGIATTTLRAVIGDILLDDVLSKRDQINEVLRAKLDEQTERWGGKVTTVEIREIIPPRDVQDAMNRMLSAERNRRAVITESEGARQSNINVAEGEKQAAILRAEGVRQSRILEAEGFSQALEQIFGAARMVDERTMVIQYLEALKVLGTSPSTKYILPLELTELAQRVARFVDRGMEGAAEDDERPPAPRTPPTPPAPPPAAPPTPPPPPPAPPALPPPSTPTPPSPPALPTDTSPDDTPTEPNPAP